MRCMRKTGARILGRWGRVKGGQSLTVATRRADCYRSRLFPFRPHPKPMPTYEYECAKCKKTFELFQSMKDDALTTCPRELCRQKAWGKGKVSRMLGTGAGLIFKGSGFYITDYRSDGYKAAAKSDSGSGSSGGEKAAASDTGTKKTEAKAAAAEKKPAKKSN